MTPEELHQRLEKVFHSYDLTARIRIAPFNGKMYWGEIVSDLWVGMSVPVRTRIARRLIAARDSELHESRRLIVFPVTPTEARD